MIGFLLAIQFLTVFPIKIKRINDKDLAGSVKYFPLVGLLLGLFFAGLNKSLLILNFPEISANIILVVALVIITAGMHLDGLSDTADAFLSGKPKEEMLAIMRDSHVGVMGALSLISIILLKIGLLSSVSTSLKTIALLLMCVLSRWSVVLSMFLFDYARQEGKARAFMQGMNLKIFVFSSIIVFVLAFSIWQMKGLFALLIVAGCTYLGGRFASRKIGGITGDILGATIELMEIVTLLTVSIS